MWIPGQGEQYPTLAKTEPVEVMSGKEVTLDLTNTSGYGTANAPGLRWQMRSASRVRRRRRHPVRRFGAALRRPGRLRGPGSVTLRLPMVRDRTT